MKCINALLICLLLCVGMLVSCGAPYADEPPALGASTEVPLVDDEPTIDEPIVEEPVTEEPTVEEPVVGEEPATVVMEDYMDIGRWVGNTDKFRVRPLDAIGLYTYFVLNDTQKGTAHMAAPSTRLRGGCWEFRCYLNGTQPTKTAQARFYVASNSDNLQGALQGYFLAIGIIDESKTGSSDGQFLSLCRQDGTAVVRVIDCSSEFLLVGYTQFDVRLTCDEDGYWQLQGRLGDSAWKQWGKGVDATYTQSRYLGIYCQYPKSQSENYAFGNIQVGV